MSGTKSDSDPHVQPRPSGGWEVVKEKHERASAVVMQPNTPYGG